MIRPSALLLSAAFAAAFAAPAAANGVKKPLGVVELFTSQGCNSCPPADAVLDRLAKRGDLVALSYHVDYWDYLGWKDTLASRANTERQYDYAKSFGARSVYTPQAVVNGRKDVNGADGAAVAGLVERLGRSGDGLSVDVSATYADERVVVQTGDARGPEKEANVVFVYFDPEKTVRIERGENRGKTITYRNAVLSVQTAGMWNGKAARFEMPESEMTRQGAHGCAVLLQATEKDGLPGPIIGAAMLEKPAS
jgi:hypothetical protein